MSKKKVILVLLTLIFFLQPSMAQKIRKLYLHSGLTVSALSTSSAISEGYPEPVIGNSIGVGAEWFGNTTWGFASNLDYQTFGGNGVYNMTDISGTIIMQMPARFDFHDICVAGIFAYKRPQLNYVPKVFAGPRFDFLVSGTRGGLAGINFGIDAGIGIAKAINNSVEFSADLIYHQLFIPVMNGYYSGQLLQGEEYSVRPKYFFTLQFGFSFYFEGVDAL